MIVIGAGISGLTAALALKNKGIDTLLLEANPYVGGAAHTLHRDGYLCESGPNTLMLSSPEAIQFLEKTGLLSSALDAAPHAKKRFVVQEGKLIPLPVSPFAFCTNNILSWKAKFRLFREPFISKGTNENETIANFFRRRFGEEVLHELVDPFISGIYAGDPERLILCHALPKLYELEKTHGSLIRGMICSKKKGQQNRLISWPGGLSDLAKGLAASLGECVLLSTPVRWIKKERNQFVIGTDKKEFQSDRVILATDIHQAESLLSPIFQEAASLKKMTSAPMCVVHLGFQRSVIGHPLDGFGVLISRKRKIRTLGALFSSTLFPSRAPEGYVLLTAFVGGMHDLESVSLNDATLIQTVLKDLTPLLGITGAPTFQNIIRWPRAIPQYEKDYSHVLETCGEVEKTYLGLYLLGNYRGGISLSDCLTQAKTLVDKIADDQK